MTSIPLEEAVEFSEDTLVAQDESLVDALDNMGLVKGPGGFGKKLALTAVGATGVGLIRIFHKMYLVPDGQMGLTVHNGSPVFLRPGRYVLLSFLHNFIRNVSLNDDIIQHGPITIVTIKKGELGVSWKNGHLIILEQGRHILRAPHTFETTQQISKQFIEMGPYKRILVNEGQIGIAYDTGKLVILDPGLHIRTSPTFTFKEFVSIQSQVKRLEPLKVNTNDGIAIMVSAVITYKIDDPIKAFKDVQKVTQALFDRAEATLTSIFLHHSIDEIAPTLPGAKNEALTTPGADDGMSNYDDDEEDPFGSAYNKDKKEKEGEKNKKHHKKRKEKGKQKVDFGCITTPLLFSDIVREAFLDQLRESVATWGLVLLDMSIEKLEFHDPELKKLLAQRASNKLQTASDRANIAAQAATGIQKAQGIATEQRIKADAELYTAEQRAKGARLQEDTHLARELALLRGLKEVVEATGNKTCFIPWNMKLDLQDGGHGYWLSEEGQAKTLPMMTKKN